MIGTISLLFLSFLFLFLFIWPMSGALLKGWEWASYDSHRVTPTPAWFFFRKRVIHDLRWWFVLWVLSFLAINWMLWKLNDGQELIEHLWGTVKLGYIISWYVFPIFALQLIISQWLRSFWGLLMASCIFTIVTHCFGYFLLLFKYQMLFIYAGPLLSILFFVSSVWYVRRRINSGKYFPG